MHEGLVYGRKQIIVERNNERKGRNKKYKLLRI